MIGKTIKSLLAAESTLTALVSTNIYPYVMNEDTILPAVVYMINSLEADYSKGGWHGDLYTFSVVSFDKDYGDLQDVVTAVRTALEMKRTGYGTQEIGEIYVDGFEEGYDTGADTFFNKLIFRLKLKNY